MSCATEHAIALHRPRPAPASDSERWSVEAIEALFERCMPELWCRAQTVHRHKFSPAQIDLRHRLSMLRGAPELR
jgi:biotin synthase